MKKLIERLERRSNLSEAIITEPKRSKKPPKNFTEKPNPYAPLEDTWLYHRKQERYGADRDETEEEWEARRQKGGKAYAEKLEPKFERELDRLEKALEAASVPAIALMHLIWEAHENGALKDPYGNYQRAMKYTDMLDHFDREGITKGLGGWQAGGWPDE